MLLPSKIILKVHICISKLVNCCLCLLKLIKCCFQYPKILEKIILVIDINKKIKNYHI